MMIPLNVKTDLGEGKIYKDILRNRFELHNWNIRNHKQYDRLRLKSPHFHNEFQIGYITKGSIENKYRKKYVPIGTHQLYIIPPGEIHEEHVIAGTDLSFNFILIDPSLFEYAISNSSEMQDKQPVFDNLLVGDSLLNETLLVKLQTVFSSFANQAADLEKEESLMDFVTSMITENLTGTAKGRTVSEKAIIRNTKEYLREHLYDTITLDILSKELFVSKFHLGRIFSKETGITIHKYFLHLKICKAKELLKQGDDINAICSKLGFTDKSHFTHCFKKLTAQTPGQF